MTNCADPKGILQLGQDLAPELAFPELRVGPLVDLT
jgi:hypothetical protein